VSVAAPYKHYADRGALLAALVLRGYRAQAARFAAAYVAFAAQERALFQVTFAAGLDKSAYPDLAEAGDAVMAVLSAPAARLTCRPRDLVLDVAAAAHGVAVFLLEGVLADDAGAAADRAADTARAIIARRREGGVASDA